MDVVQRITQPYKLASRQFHPENSVLPLDGFTVGGNEIVVIAGPCSVESRSQIIETAIAVKEAGASALRGGVFKPRTSPYAFQGLGEEGLEYLAEAREQTGLPIVAEIMSQVQVDLMVKYVDVSAGWRAQHAELQSVACHRRDSYQRSAQARTLRHH